MVFSLGTSPFRASRACARVRRSELTSFAPHSRRSESSLFARFPHSSTLEFGEREVSVRCSYVCSSVRNSVPHLLTFPPLTTFLTPSSTSSHLPPLRSVLRTSLRYGRCSSLRKVLVVTESAARTRARGFRNRPLGAFSVARPRICSETVKIIPREKILGLEVRRASKTRLFRNF